ncbi:MAG: PilZ domain-containing protein [Pseudomonadota bacterium]
MKTRKTSRIPIDAVGSYRTSRGMQWDVELADLSEGGCRIFDPRGRAELGQYVRLYIAGTGPHLAEVAWRSGENVGFAFTRPLPERVFTSIAAADGQDAAPVDTTANAPGVPRRFV